MVLGGTGLWKLSSHEGGMVMNRIMCTQSLSHVRLFATPWTAAHQAPLSMGLPRQEYWSGFPTP